MAKGRMKINIRLDVVDVLSKLSNYKVAAQKAIEEGVKYAAEILLQDCRPYVPMLTGALRDSGHVVDLENYAFKLVWDAASPTNGYIYARRQYEEIFQHVDGRYAAKWVEDTLNANPDRYTFLTAFRMKIELQKLFGQGA